MKKCKKCNIDKPLNCFNKNQKKTDGLHIWCKECSSLKNKERYDLKKDYIKNQTSEYYINNKEIILPKLKVYRDKDEIKEKQKIYIKKWVSNNLDSYRKYQNAYLKERRKTDPQFKTICDLRTQIDHFLIGSKKTLKTENLLGYTYNNFIDTVGIKQEGQEIDHKIPISWFKENTPINVIWDLRNLQIVSKEYNRSKKNTFADNISQQYYQTVIKWIKPSQLSMISTYV